MSHSVPFRKRLKDFLRRIFRHYRRVRVLHISRDYRVKHSVLTIRGGESCLTEAQVKESRARWIERYRPSHVGFSDLYHRFYSGATGVYSPDYIPDDLYYEVIDPFFSNWKKGEVMDNKCLYARYFPDMPFPYTVAYRMNGAWLDGDYQAVSSQTLREKLEREREVIVKLATDSMGGKGVYFLSGEALADQVTALTAKLKGDLVIQRVIRQHAELAKINASSVNTIRHLSFLSEGKAKVYSSIIRMGVGDSRVDNASSGGITCGITPSGRLKPVAYSNVGQRFDRHPTTGIAFDSIVVPSFAESVKQVERLHESFPLFRLISWDIAIDEAGTPTLIEANLYYGELDFHQLNNGPLFGDDQAKILSEVDWGVR